MGDGNQDKLRIRCDCGATLAVPAAAMGRRARCPKCQQTVEIVPSRAAAPQATMSASADASEGSSIAASPARIRVTCACGARIGVPPEAAGRRARCPKCRAAVEIPRTEPSWEASQSGASPLELFESLSAGEAVAPPASAAAGDLPLELAPLDESVRRAREEVRAVPAPSGPSLKCPSCGVLKTPGVKICIECGIDLKTRKPILMVDDENLDVQYSNAEGVIWWLSWLFPIGVYPIGSEAFGARTPWVVRGVVTLTIVVSVWYMWSYIYDPAPAPGLQNLMYWAGDPNTALTDAELWDDASSAGDELTATAGEEHDAELDAAMSEYLEDYTGRRRWYQPITSAFLHADPIHLAGNLLFLTVFGSRVNALVGNTLTLLLYPVLAAASAFAHGAAMRDENWHPLLGASGAISGLAGMYLIFFPIHKVHMAAWWRWGWLQGFHLSMKIWPVTGVYVVMFFYAFDFVYIAMSVDDGVAYWAHVGGFLFGIVLAAGLLVARLANGRGADLLTLVLGRSARYLIGKPNRPGLSLW